MRKRHVVVLSEEERAQLHTLIGRGCPGRTLTHARILLKANQGEAGPAWTDGMIAGAGGEPRTVFRVRKAYATGGLDAALHARRPRASTAAGSTASRRPT